MDLGSLGQVISLTSALSGIGGQDSNPADIAAIESFRLLGAVNKRLANIESVMIDIHEAIEALPEATEASLRRQTAFEAEQDLRARMIAIVASHDRYVNSVSLDGESPTAAHQRHVDDLQRDLGELSVSLQNTLDAYPLGMISGTFGAAFESYALLQTRVGPQTVAAQGRAHIAKIVAQLDGPVEQAQQRLTDEISQLEQSITLDWGGDGWRSGGAPFDREFSFASYSGLFALFCTEVSIAASGFPGVVQYAVNSESANASVMSSHMIISRREMGEQICGEEVSPTYGVVKGSEIFANFSMRPGGYGNSNFRSQYPNWMSEARERHMARVDSFTHLNILYLKTAVLEEYEEGVRSALVDYGLALGNVASAENADITFIDAFVGAIPFASGITQDALRGLSVAERQEAGRQYRARISAASLALDIEAAKIQDRFSQAVMEFEESSGQRSIASVLKTIVSGLQLIDTLNLMDASIDQVFDDVQKEEIMLAAAVGRSPAGSLVLTSTSPNERIEGLLSELNALGAPNGDPFGPLTRQEEILTEAMSILSGWDETRADELHRNWQEGRVESAVEILKQLPTPGKAMQSALREALLPRTLADGTPNSISMRDQHRDTLRAFSQEILRWRLRDIDLERSVDRLIESSSPRVIMLR